MNWALHNLMEVSIAFWGLVMTYYSVMLGTQRLPNFTYSLFKVLKHSICYFFISFTFRYILDISSDNENIVKYVEISFLFITFFWIGYFIIEEAQKLYYYRCHYRFWDVILNFLHFSKNDEVSDTRPISKNIMDEFCSVFFTDQKDRIQDVYKSRNKNSISISDSISIFFTKSNRLELDDKLLAITSWALSKDLNVLYLSCNRHPYEYYEKLRMKISDDKLPLDKMKQQLILVDAHSCHFGFREKIYKQLTKKITEEGVTLVTARWSYLGIHSAISHGYKNHFDKKRNEKLPTILLYDSCYCLTDFENDKQYKILLEHIIPSERLYHGNITIFCEQWIPERLSDFVEANFDAVSKI